MNTPVSVITRCRFSQIAFTVCLTLLGCTSGDTPEVTFERGRLLADRGQFDDAIPFYDKALAANFESPELFYERGRAFENLNLLDKALLDYESALKLSPELSQAINNKGVVLAKLERFQDAADVFSQLIQMREDDVLALRNRGLCFHDLGQFEKALADYDQALKVAEDDAVTWFQRGNVFLEQDKLTEAVADFSHAIDLDPAYAKAWMNRGVARFQMQEREAALQDLKQAQQLDDSIVLPAIDWLTVANTTASDSAATAADQRTAARPVMPETASDSGWQEVQAAAQQALTEHGISDLQLITAFPSQLCGRFAAKKGDQQLDVYVGVTFDKASDVVVPAVDVENKDQQRALLVLSFGEVDQAFREARFIADWNPAPEQMVPKAVSVQLPQK